jgi:hypothetical protein
VAVISPAAAAAAVSGRHSGIVREVQLLHHDCADLGDDGGLGLRHVVQLSLVYRHVVQKEGRVRVVGRTWPPTAHGDARPSDGVLTRSRCNVRTYQPTRLPV